jgi:hypothetical protein
MATITWTSTTAANWNTPAAWSGGVVPGVNDTAVFTSTANGGASGNCTLDVDVPVLGFKLLSNYSGTFSYNGRKLKVGNNGLGVCHIFKEVAESTNATLDIDCSDVILYSQQVNCTFYASCDLRLGGIGVARGTINADKIVTFRKSKHPEYDDFTPLTYYFHSGGRFDIYGILDVSEADRLQSDYRIGVPSLHFTTGTLRNTSGRILPVTGIYNGSLSVGRLDGQFDLSWTTRINNAVIQGDLRQFHDMNFLLSSSGAITSVSFANSTFDKMKIKTEQTVNTTVTLPSASDIYGDVIVTQTGAGAITLQTSGGGTPSFSIAGTNDQQIGVMNNTVNITANKLAGKTTFLTGIYELQSNAFFTGGLEFSATFAGIFYANDWDIHTESDINSSNASGTVRLGKLLLTGDKNQSIRLSENTDMSTINITKPSTADVTLSLTRNSNGYLVGNNICKTLINDASYVVIGNGAVLDCIYNAKGKAEFASDGNGTWRARGLIRQTV